MTLFTLLLPPEQVPDIPESTGAMPVGSYMFVTSSRATFDPTDVGREIWGKYDSNGEGGGRMRITQYISDYKVRAKITSEFPKNSRLEEGNWYFTTDRITGLGYLEGEQVRAIVDGGAHRPLTVENGEIQLDAQAGVVYVGLGYTGIIKTLNLDVGGQSGPAEGKPRNAYKTIINFLNSVGAKFGTTVYNLQKLIMRKTNDYTGRPTAPFTGSFEVNFRDNYDDLDKRAVVVQEQPLPCTVLGFDIFMDVTDEQ